MEDHVWCSEIVYDEARPEARGRIAMADAVRKAYGAAEERGYRVIWDFAEVAAVYQHVTVVQRVDAEAQLS